MELIRDLGAVCAVTNAILQSERSLALLERISSP